MPQAQVFEIRDGALAYGRAPGVNKALMAGAFFAAWNDERQVVSSPTAPMCRHVRDIIAGARKILAALAQRARALDQMPR